MIIAVNTRLLRFNKLEGIGRFSYELLKRITQAHPEHTFIFIFDQPYHKDFIFSENITPIVLKPTTRHPLLWYFWFHLRLPQLLKKIKADIFLSPDGFIPLKCNAKTISIIHDINFVHFPNSVPLAASLYYRYYFKKYAQTANALITVSEFSKNDLIQSYQLNEKKIQVVYNGSNHLSKYTNKPLNDFKNPYFLYVGSIHPRKNLPNTLKAFLQFKKETNSMVKFIIAGEQMKWSAVDISFAQDNPDIQFLGRVSDEKLKALYAHALALSYIPFFEGFGIPLVEAMNAGIPIITSNQSSLPEIGGDAAIYCNPNNTEEIKNAMIAVFSNESLRKKLIESGAKQKMKFSWDDSANKLWQIIEETNAHA